MCQLATFWAAKYVTTWLVPTEWLCYDDSNVWKIHESHVLEKEAYILFYMRRENVAEWCVWYSLLFVYFCCSKIVVLYWVKCCARRVVHVTRHYVMLQMVATIEGHLWGKEVEGEEEYGSNNAPPSLVSRWRVRSGIIWLGRSKRFEYTRTSLRKYSKIRWLSSRTYKSSTSPYLSTKSSRLMHKSVFPTLYRGGLHWWYSETPGVASPLSTRS